MSTLPAGTGPLVPALMHGESDRSLMFPARQFTSRGSAWMMLIPTAPTATQCWNDVAMPPTRFGPTGAVFDQTMQLRTPPFSSHPPPPCPDAELPTTVQ